MYLQVPNGSSLDTSLDEVRGRILGTKALPSFQEVFFEVRQEESRIRVMMGRSDIPSTLDGLALAAHKDHLSMPKPAGFAIRGVLQNSGDNQARRGRPWCDNCKKVGHVKQTC